MAFLCSRRFMANKKIDIYISYRPVILFSTEERKNKRFIALDGSLRVTSTADDLRCLICFWFVVKKNISKGTRVIYFFRKSEYYDLPGRAQF